MVEALDGARLGEREAEAEISLEEEIERERRGERPQIIDNDRRPLSASRGEELPSGGVAWRRGERPGGAAELESGDTRDLLKAGVELSRSEECPRELQERLNPEVSVEVRARRIKVDDEDILWTEMGEAAGQVRGQKAPPDPPSTSADRDLKLTNGERRRGERAQIFSSAAQRRVARELNRGESLPEQLIFWERERWRALVEREGLSPRERLLMGRRRVGLSLLCAE